MNETPAICAREKQVHGEIGRLIDQVGRLDKAITELEEILEPVLSHETTARGPDVPEDEVCRLAHDIRIETRSVRDIVDRVLSIKSRLEI